MARQQEEVTHDWWLLLETHEPTFLSPSSPRYTDYVAEGATHLSKSSLVKRGLKKVIHIATNIVEFKAPFSPLTLTPQLLGDYIGIKKKIPIIESMTQQEMGPVPMKEWLEYYQQNPAARHAILNVVSLEFSATKLAKHIGRPRFIREIDWIEHLWPEDIRSSGDYPAVERYLLMGAAGSYTNFHIDFGGSSVWYNVVKGKKIFLLTPPTDDNLDAFNDWYLAPLNESSYFPLNASNTVMCEVNEGESIVIPGGWAHAVYTPVDSIAFGGNFLHGFNSEIQLKIHGVEENWQDAQKYRFPFFEEMMWYAAASYTSKIHDGKAKQICQFEKRGLKELSEWLKFYKEKRPDSLDPAAFIIDTLRNWHSGKKLPVISAYEDDAESTEGASCFCKGRSSSQLWIGCTDCGHWFHAACVGLSEKQVNAIGNDDYFCPRCPKGDTAKLKKYEQLAEEKFGKRRGKKRRRND